MSLGVLEFFPQNFFLYVTTAHSKVKRNIKYSVYFAQQRLFQWQTWKLYWGNDEEQYAMLLKDVLWMLHRCWKDLEKCDLYAWCRSSNKVQRTTTFCTKILSWCQYVFVRPGGARTHKHIYIEFECGILLSEVKLQVCLLQIRSKIKEYRTTAVAVQQMGKNNSRVVLIFHCEN